MTKSAGPGPNIFEEFKKRDRWRIIVDPRMRSARKRKLGCLNVLATHSDENSNEDERDTSASKPAPTFEEEFDCTEANRARVHPKGAREYLSVRLESVAQLSPFFSQDDVHMSLIVSLVYSRSTHVFLGSLARCLMFILAWISLLCQLMSCCCV